MQYHTIKINKIYCKNNDYNHVISLNNNVLSVTKRNNEGVDTNWGEIRVW